MRTAGEDPGNRIHPGGCRPDGDVYTKAWRILKRAEEEMGVNLITRVSGGKNGGSSTLTDEGEQAVRGFRGIEAKVAAYADELMRSDNTFRRG